MSLKLNVAANYASQLYATLIGIVLVPLYLKTMGTEAYGLVGFFSMLQAWFNVLDLGLTPTIARESARFFGGALAPIDYRRLYRSLSVIFAVVALVGGGILFALAPAVSGKWLHVRELNVAEVVAAVQIMAASVAMRWMGGLYRGVITGAERLVWLSGFNALIATLRFAAVFASMAIWGFTPAVFFWHQLAVATIELGTLFAMATRLVPPRTAQEAPTGWSFDSVRPLLRFSLTIAFTSSVWVFVTQTDKLILSGVLPLSEYGFFTLAVLVAGGITIVTGPITTALLPRLARLQAQGDHAEILRLYHQFAQLVAVVAISLMVTLAGSAESLIYAWTGNREVTLAAAPILRLYALGNGLLALGAFPFYLQYARGSLRWHLIGNIGLVVLLIPAIVLAATRAGGVGAGWVWVTMNVLYLFGWVAFVHGRLEPGLHKDWIVRNVLAILLPTALVGAALALLLPDSLGQRSTAFIHVGIYSTICFVTAVLSSHHMRQRMGFGVSLRRA
jgi:O-antigen/teichoic acid export membrane protein